MRAFLIFLVLIVLVTCQPSNERMEERSRRRKEHQMKIAECILKSSDASPEFKKSIEENKDTDLRRVFHPRDHSLDYKDYNVLRTCRREMFEKLREEHRMGRDHFGSQRHGNF